jgi:hypothetical protein
VGMPLYGVISGITILIPTILGLLRYRWLAEEVKLFLFLQVVNSLTVIAQFVLAYYYINNLWSSHLYTLCEVILILLSYRNWQNGEKARSVLFVTAIVYAVFWLLLKLTIENLKAPSTYASPVSRAILMIASFQMLYALARDSEESILSDGRFWLVAATMIFAAGGVMFYALQGIIFTLQKEMILKVFNAYWTLIILVHLTYAWGFICSSTRQNSGGRLASAQ